MYILYVNGEVRLYGMSGDLILEVLELLKEDAKTVRVVKEDL